MQNSPSCPKCGEEHPIHEGISLEWEGEEDDGSTIEGYVTYGLCSGCGVRLKDIDGEVEEVREASEWDEIHRRANELEDDGDDYDDEDGTDDLEGDD